MTDDPIAIARGRPAADVDPRELVDDNWIESNTKPGKKPSKARLAARGLTPRALQRSPITRDQMRRICQRAGLAYTEAWSGHNKGKMSGVWGALCHHTGTPWSAAGDYPTLRIVRDGRSDLQNSLSAFGLGKSGRVYLISEKLSWHAGAGNINGLTDGNGLLLGIEAESDGKHWTPEQVDAYPRLVASILVEIGQDDRYTTRHGSYALPAGRKSDFAGWPGGTGAFWAAVYRWQAVYTGQVAPPPAFPIKGAISAAYNRPGRAVALGAPLGPEVPTGDPKGRWQEFANGAIFWHPAIDGGNAHVVQGEIYKKWRQLGRESWRGFPVTDEVTTPDGRGRFNHFATNGSIYWTPTTGAHPVSGAVRDQWAASGWEKGFWGYPVADPEAVGVQRFEHHMVRV